MADYKTIAESKNFIVLDKFTKYYEVNEAPAVYQTEASLEREFIQDLMNQGYENPTNLTTQEAMLANVRTQLQSLNNMAFSDTEWGFGVLEFYFDQYYMVQQYDLKSRINTFAYLLSKNINID
jgi:type I restriction enzyme R subunit